MQGVAINLCSRESRTMQIPKLDIAECNPSS